jgi:hypothetical protein
LDDPDVIQKIRSVYSYARQYEHHSRSEGTLVIPVAFQLPGILPGGQRHPARMQMQSDFPNYYTSAKLVSTQANLDSLYNNRWFNEQIKKQGMEMEGKFSPFTPPTAFVMLPFVSLDPLTAKRTWMIVNILLIFLCGGC